MYQAPLALLALPVLPEDGCDRRYRRERDAWRQRCERLDRQHR